MSSFNHHHLSSSSSSPFVTPPKKPSSTKKISTRPSIAHNIYFVSLTIQRHLVQIKEKEQNQHDTAKEMLDPHLRCIERIILSQTNLQWMEQFEHCLAKQQQKGSVSHNALAFSRNHLQSRAKVTSKPSSALLEAILTIIRGYLRVRHLNNTTATWIDMERLTTLIVNQMLLQHVSAFEVLFELCDHDTHRFIARILEARETHDMVSLIRALLDYLLMNLGSTPERQVIPFMVNELLSWKFHSVDLMQDEDELMPDTFWEWMEFSINVGADEERATSYLTLVQILFVATHDTELVSSVLTLIDCALYVEEENVRVTLLTGMWDFITVCPEYAQLPINSIYEDGHTVLVKSLCNFLHSPHSSVQKISVIGMCRFLMLAELTTADAVPLLVALAQKYCRNTNKLLLEFLLFFFQSYHEKQQKHQEELSDALQSVILQAVQEEKMSAISLSIQSDENKSTMQHLVSFLLSTLSEESKYATVSALIPKLKAYAQTDVDYASVTRFFRLEE
mmetsp:Transcript_10142/g.37742  ORF Transcript_10142/g.37742 Transcript_10142/m.37742 type:complete len:506 (+) Transcript_10142:123-1640(+)